MAPAVPRTPAEIFAEVASRFEIDDKVRDWLTSPEGLGAKSLEDFLFAASTPADLEKLATAAAPTNVLLSTSRLRQARESLTTARDQDSAIRKRGMDEADMDKLLDQPSLDDIEARHWARYKMTWPPEVAPADLAVSRITREIDKRLLSVREVLKVRSQSQQQKSTRKRIRVGEGVEVLTNEDIMLDRKGTLQNYLQRYF